MDAQGRNSASDMGDTGSSNTGLSGIKDQATEKATQLKNKVSDLGRKAGDRIDEQRVRAAGTFENTASALHERGDQFASTASSAAHADGSAEGLVPPDVHFGCLSSLPPAFFFS